MRPSLVLVGVFVPSLLAASPASARDIPCQAVDPGVIAVDGVLGDWQGVAPVKLDDSGIAVSIRCNYTQDDLFFAVEASSASQIELLFGAGETGPVTRLTVGSSHASSWSGPHSPTRRSAPVVVADTPTGWLFEASVARSSLPLADPTTPALPFALVAKGGGHTLSTSGALPPRGPLDRLELAAGAATLDNFLQQVHASRGDITWDHLARVNDGAGLQRVVIAGEYLGVITASDYIYAQLPVATPADVTGADLVDLSGDGRVWILVRYTERGGGGSRDVLAGFRTKADAFLRPFAHEVEKRVGDSILMDRWSYVPDGERHDVVFTAEPPVGFTQQTFREAPATDIGPILLPWDEKKKKEVWKFSGDSAILGE